MKLRELNEEIRVRSTRQKTSITFIDIDETLFNTNAKIHVIKDGKILKKLHNTEFNTYDLQDGESFDFVEFSDAEIFVKTSEPITPMIDTLKVMFKNIKSKGSGDMYLLTARGDFDNKEKFLDFLVSYGIPVGHVNDGDIHIIRAGNTVGSSSAKKKQVIIRKFLDTNTYSVVQIFDDALSNLNAFLDLKEEFPDVTFKAYEVKHGKIIKYTREKQNET